MHAVRKSEMRVSCSKPPLCRASAILALLLALVLCGDSMSAPQGQTKKLKPDRGADFFADPSLRVFEIEVSDAGHTALKQTPRSYIAGTVREGGHTWTKVGIHLKGM